MTTLTLDYGLILVPPDPAVDLACLFEEWQNLWCDDDEGCMIRLNPMIYYDLEEEYE